VTEKGKHTIKFVKFSCEEKCVKIDPNVSFKEQVNNEHFIKGLLKEKNYKQIGNIVLQKSSTIGVRGFVFDNMGMLKQLLEQNTNNLINCQLISIIKFMKAQEINQALQQVRGIQSIYLALQTRQKDFAVTNQLTLGLDEMREQDQQALNNIE